MEKKLLASVVALHQTAISSPEVCPEVATDDNPTTLWKAMQVLLNTVETQREAILEKEKEIGILRAQLKAQLDLAHDQRAMEDDFVRAECLEDAMRKANCVFRFAFLEAWDKRARKIEKQAGNLSEVRNLTLATPPGAGRMHPLDPRSRTVLHEGKAIPLTEKECEFLAVLILARGDIVKGPETGIVYPADVAMSIRRKMEDVKPGSGGALYSRSGSGYAWRPVPPREE